MQKRIAKLKRLQDKIAQLKDDRDFVTAYAEVDAAASDSDDSDDEAPAPSAPASSSPAFTSATAASVPASPASGSTEELRRWVAALLAQNGSRRAAAAIAAGTPPELEPGPGTGLEMGTRAWAPPAGDQAAPGPASGGGAGAAAVEPAAWPRTGPTAPSQPRYRRYGVYRDARCVLALHNLAHQGAHPPHCYVQLGLPAEWYGALEWVDTGSPAPGGPAGQRTPTINILKAALVTSDRLLTVSPAYAAEICDEGSSSSASGASSGSGGSGQAGCGLSSLLRQRAADLAGIVNGIDPREWDPRTDPYIPRNYHEGPYGPHDQVVLLGSGAADYEDALRAAQAAYPANVRAYVGFSVPLSHRILAAADILLMPSRFEPCGLNQLYAQRYGTVPVAHGTGGLRDTIADVSPFAMEQREEGSGGGWGREAEDLEELFATSLAWGRRTAPRSADDPDSNNADYYEPFQDYFGASGRYGPVAEEEEDGAGGEDDEADTDMAPNWGWGVPAAAYNGSANGNHKSAPAKPSSAPANRRTGPPTLPLPAIRDSDLPPPPPGAAASSSYLSPDGRRRRSRRRAVGTGWTFAPATEEALLEAVGAALTVYEHHPDKWRAIQVAGMRRDFSWGRAAAQWEAVMEAALGAPAYCK
ncbi:hypothetical protein GPECTOR_263g678 [Gonium pectorale]|uniref:Starch synthase catalytic domain-containing protein n=1 Tax=Gonium pectorale TaxID=33097 RepID=A0A150FWA0_GONPE|nr:hypothetical protein GPECTOR_263g678 [Gonium pectorale]|eukprot:KXZ41848.1 hypothetical protein GPECTOR_263g678 [Gonium pectorale]